MVIIILSYKPSISLHLIWILAWLAVPDTDSRVTCSTDMDSHVTCSKKYGFLYKLHAAARLPLASFPGEVRLPHGLLLENSFLSKGYFIHCQRPTFEITITFHTPPDWCCVVTSKRSLSLSYALHLGSFTAIKFLAPSYNNYVHCK